MRGSFLNWGASLTVVIWIVPFPLQVQSPEVDVGDVDVCELRLDRHGAELRWAITWLCVGLCYATKGETLNIRGSCLGQSHGRWDQERVEKRKKEGGKVGDSEMKPITTNWGSIGSRLG